MGIIVGNDVKFINDEDLYSDPEWVEEKVNLPTVDRIYKVRGISAWGGLLLEGIENSVYSIHNHTGELGFGEERFKLVILKECKTIDDVLDKISEHGIKSLNISEVKILKG